MGLFIFTERVTFWISETFLGFQKVGKIGKKECKGRPWTSEILGKCPHTDNEG